MVFGVEGDLSAANVEYSESILGITGTLGINWLSSLRVRLGFAPTDGLLIYGTGGVAWGEAEVSASIGALSASLADTMFGFVIGGGAEMQFAQGLSGRLEVLYYKFSDQRLSIGGVGSLDYDADVTVVRAGLNWRPY